MEELAQIGAVTQQAAEGPQSSSKSLNKRYRKT